MTATDHAGAAGVGPAVLLVHGVGPGPETFVEIARLLAMTHRVLIVTRPGYGSAESASRALDEQLASVWDQAAAIGPGPYRWVGVSGGATLGVLAALRHPHRLAGLLAHEPLFGPLAPALHTQIVHRARRMATDHRPEAAVEYVEELVGESWQRLPVQTADAVRDRHATIRAEVPHFVDFAPSEEALAAVRVPATISVGERSGQVRHRAVAIGASIMGARVRVVQGSGHLPQVDHPHGFAELVRTTTASFEPRGRCSE